MLDYKHIEALAKVIQEGGFERAAQALFLTQSAVSQRVRQLEESSGQILKTSLSPDLQLISVDEKRSRQRANYSFQR